MSINIRELTNLLNVMPAQHNIMLVGKHGIGKSEILTQYFSKFGIKVVTLFLGQMSDPGDLIGLPRKNETTGKTEFMPPYWFPTDGKPIVLFLDELNRARPEILQTIMDLALNKKLAGRALPEGSRIISAVNDGDEYQLTDLDPALVSRFNIYDFSPTAEEWLLWAEAEKLDARIINFLQENKQFLDNKNIDGDNGLKKTPDRRAWQRVSELICGNDSLGIEYRKFIAGIVGVEATMKFFTFIEQINHLSAKDLLLNYDRHAPELKKLKLHEISILNEELLRFLNERSREEDVEIVKVALEKYLNWLAKKREAFAHFISLYETGTYSNAVLFVTLNLPKIYKKITQFINEI